MSDLTVAMVAPALPYFPVWIAEERKFFADHGLAVTTLITGTTDKVTSSIADGESQLAMVTPEGVVVNAASGGSLRLIAGNTNRAPLSLIAQPHIKRIEDLAGKKIGTSSLKEGTAILVQRMLAAHSLHYPADYEFSLVGAHPQRWQHLQDGTIDAGLQLVPYDYIAEDSGYNNLGDAWTYVPDYAFTAVAVESGWAQANADVVVNALRAFREALDWTAAHLDEAAEIVSPKVGGDRDLNRRGLAALFEHNSIARDLSINREALESVFSSVREAQLLGSDADLNWNMCVADTYLSRSHE